MSDIIKNESRIFRIGTECYIVYLGTEIDDINPFLRIGNIPNIPREVHEAVSTTVIAENHVGNPLLEIANVSKFHVHYIGDTGVVLAMKRFFKSFELANAELKDYRGVQDGERRQMVWFYSNGNLQLRFNNSTIFDLRKTSIADHHFLRRYDEARLQFLRSPLHYIKPDFSKPGILLTGGNAFWFESENLMSLLAQPGYIARLMKDGVDPDLISCVISNITQDNLNSREAHTFINHLKRKRQKRKNLKVVTRTPEILRKMKLLFPAQGSIPATIDILDASKNNKVSFNKSTVSYKNNAWHIHRAGLPDISIGSRMEKGISVNVKQNSLRYCSEDAKVKKDFLLPQGFPVNFIPHSIVKMQLSSKYGTSLLKNIQDHLHPSELALAQSLEQYMQLLRQIINSGQNSFSSRLKETLQAIKEAFRDFSYSETGIFWFYLSNVISILKDMTHGMENVNPLRKDITSLYAALLKITSSIPEPDPVLPFFGDFYIRDEPVLLWRMTKIKIPDVKGTHRTNDNISQIFHIDQSLFKTELNRLLKLIRSLKKADTARLSSKENRGQTEKKQSQTVKTSSETAASGQNTSVLVHSETSAKRSIAPAISPNRGRKQRKWLPLRILVAALFLLLAGIILLWDFSGSAPWGRLIKSRNSNQIVSTESYRAATDPFDSNGSDESPEDSSNAESLSNAENTTGIDSSSVNPVSSDTSVSGDAVSSSNDESTIVADSSPVNSVSADISASDDSDEDVVRSTDTISSDASADLTQPGSAVPDTSSNPKSLTDEREQGNQVLVDINEAPARIEDVINYLNVYDRVRITEADVHLAANRIAVVNGYKDLDFRVYTGEDPDWIYPGTELILPGHGSHLVRSGDTIWFLAAREVRIEVERDLEIFDKAIAVLDDINAKPSEKTQSLTELQEIGINSQVASFRRLVQEVLEIRQ